jgi:arsenate reductase
MVTIYHNPRCSKSRECLALLETRNIPFATIKYLDTHLSKEEIKELLKILKIKPLELVRQKEQVWVEKYKGRTLTGAQIITALSKHPELIERPIVTNGYNGIIARPADKIDEILL